MRRTAPRSAPCGRTPSRPRTRWISSPGSVTARREPDAACLDSPVGHGPHFPPSPTPPTSSTPPTPLPTALAPVPTWRRSSYSSGANNCVETARTLRGRTGRTRLQGCEPAAPVLLFGRGRSCPRVVRGGSRVLSTFTHRDPRPIRSRTGPGDVQYRISADGRGGFRARWPRSSVPPCRSVRSVRSARAVSRIREMPSGTDGGRKQPTAGPRRGSRRPSARPPPATAPVRRPRRRPGVRRSVPPP